MTNLSTRLFGSTLLCISLTSPAIAATVQYNSGLATGDLGGSFNGLGIGSGIADFSLSDDTLITSFVLTMLAHDSMASASNAVNWAIYSRSGLMVSSLEASGSVTGVEGSTIVPRLGGDVYDITIEIVPLTLVAADYFLVTQQANSFNWASWAFTDTADGDTGALEIGTPSTVTGLSGYLGLQNTGAYQNRDYAFTINGNTINAVPLPPAAFAGLSMLAGLGAYRRLRK